MSFFKKSSGILGINARNLSYLYRYNSQANKKLADDKIFTKRFLQARGIGVAKLYASIGSLQELRNFNPGALPKSFVIKPNRGYGGEGIIVIKNTQGGKYLAADNEKFSWSDLAKHCISILDGRFAISGLHDKVIFEELLQPHEFFSKFVELGLPDVRIIVFKYIPVIAMLRLPTPESKGKANLHLGAIGLGIDIGTGKTTFGVHHNTLVRKLPNGSSVSGITIPQWDEILLTASKTQSMSQIGYLAVDLALTNRGIKILELNARAGIAIQISNQALLRRRLDKLADIKVASPAEGVRFGKTLFTRVVKNTMVKEQKSPKPVIGLFEYLEIINSNQGSLLAKIDPHSAQNVIDGSIALPAGQKLVTIKIRDQKIKIPITPGDLSAEKYKMVLAGKYLSGFLIDSQKIVPEYQATLSPASKEEKIIINIDKKLNGINEQISLLARLKPINLETEQKNFLKNPSSSPHFIYPNSELDVSSLKKELKKLPQQINHPLQPLFLKKIEEVDNKLSLIENIGRPEAMHFSELLYGTVTEKQYEDAVSFMAHEKFPEDTSKLLGLEEIIRRTSKYLAECKLSKWKIKVLEYATSGMQINKKNTIFISKKSKISENRLHALFAHEIDTHIFRLENGRLQKYKLLEQGTASYLLTEEGLAIYNQNKLGINLGSKFLRPAINIIAIYLGTRMSFAELWSHLVENVGIDRKKAWWICVRTKRGLQDTGQPGAFTKDRAYFVGYQIISRLVADKGLDAIKKLYLGKVGVADLKYLGDVRQWPIKHLPNYLR